MLVLASLMYVPTGIIWGVIEVKGAGRMKTWFLVGWRH
jgi:hypothetical protein